jgi:hypothetical protein
MALSFYNLTIELFLGFGNWDLELVREQTQNRQDVVPFGSADV